jgi:hypothetical protein
MRLINQPLSMLFGVDSDDLFNGLADVVEDAAASNKKPCVAPQTNGET